MDVGCTQKVNRSFSIQNSVFSFFLVSAPAAEWLCSAFVSVLTISVRQLSQCTYRTDLHRMFTLVRTTAVVFRSLAERCHGN